MSNLLLGLVEMSKVKLTPSVSSSIVASIRDLKSDRDAVSKTGVQYRTFTRWMRQGLIDEEGIYTSFRRLIVAARNYRTIALQYEIKEREIRALRGR